MYSKSQKFKKLFFYKNFYIDLNDLYRPKYLISKTVLEKYFFPYWPYFASDNTKDFPRYIVLGNILRFFIRKYYLISNKEKNYGKKIFKNKYSFVQYGQFGQFQNRYKD